MEGGSCPDVNCSNFLSLGNLNHLLKHFPLIIICVCFIRICQCLSHPFPAITSLNFTFLFRPLSHNYLFLSYSILTIFFILSTSLSIYIYFNPFPSVYLSVYRSLSLSLSLFLSLSLSLSLFLSLSLSLSPSQFISTCYSLFSLSLLKHMVLSRLLANLTAHLYGSTEHFLSPYYRPFYF